MIAWLGGAALAALVLAVAAELLARRWIRSRTGYHVWPPGLRLDLRQDAEAFRQVEPRVRFAVNVDGERGDDVAPHTPGLFRVLVAGGSSAECLALDQPTSWPGALQRLLSSPTSLRALDARRVHVGNIGRSGIGSRQLDLILKHVLPQYRRLDLLVIMVGASDVLRWLEEGAPPSPGPDPEVEDVFSSHPCQQFRWTPRQCALYALAGRLRRRWLRPVEIREHAGSWLVAARRMRAEARETRHTTPDPGVVLRAFDRHFRSAVRRAMSYARRVLVVRQPWFDREPAPDEAAHFWHGGVGKAWKQTLTVFYGLDVLHDLMSRLDARAAAIARDLGVADLDLRPILTPSLDHYFDMFHYTPQGAALVARAVADAVLGAPPADRAAPPRIAARGGALA
jgi:lysophospholipase L1-like esterase